MARLIDGDALREHLYHEAFEEDNGMQKWDSGLWIRYKLFEQALKIATTIDAVPVVRCKDCKYYRRHLIDDVTGLPMCGAWAAPQNADGYCNYGKRLNEAD